jgi:hypothetical protein
VDKGADFAEDDDCVEDKGKSLLEVVEYGVEKNETY